MGNRPRRAITRSRTGCWTCRNRHTKCDEEKPACRSCTRLGLHCAGYAIRLIFLNDAQALSSSPIRESESIVAIETSSSNTAEPQPRRAPDDIEAPSLLSVFPGTPISPACEIETPPGEFTTSTRHGASPDDQGVTRTDAAAELIPDSPAWFAQPPLSFSPIDPRIDDNDLDVPPSPWLHNHFPPQLAPVFRDIWEGVGYGNAALKYALLALSPLQDPRGRAEVDKRRQLELYSLALQATAHDLPCAISAAQAAVMRAVLALFLQIEIRIGSFIGGYTHAKQADRLVVEHMSGLASWVLGRRLLCEWAAVKSWYSLQCGAWTDTACLVPWEVRQPLLLIISSDGDAHQSLLPLLCEAQRVFMRILLARLVGPGPAYPSYGDWCRQLERLRPDTAPRHGLYGSGTGAGSGSEDSFLARLAELQDELDCWHDRLALDELPVYGTTARSKTRLSVEPLRFRSHCSAANYLRYAVAQLLCSRSNIDAYTGGSLTRGNMSRPAADNIHSPSSGTDANQQSDPDSWAILVFQIIAGMDPQDFFDEDTSRIGPMWVVSRLLLLCSRDADLLDAVAGLLPRLEGIGTRLGSIYPSWLLKRLVACVQAERTRNRVVLYIHPEFGPAEEWVTFYTAPVAFRALLVGRLIDTGAAFYEIVNIM
ncbi:hypothetical protein TsFJ059_006867 [Trichoderma semiorbis]|uniref:Zn(2)-C6 fungal-type domain-containing protein n=1 Tax=Trichoderma semiorbis TaxID=1491008 RepID=A0A9P8HFM2_9HYPO|nr:hypothetical protein TsFJ059_006867 [Trichoderma semiorbis]